MNRIVSGTFLEPLILARHISAEAMVLVTHPPIPVATWTAWTWGPGSGVLDLGSGRCSFNEDRFTRLK